MVSNTKAAERRRMVRRRNSKIMVKWKIEQKKCCDCAKAITETNSHHFDIDHVDPQQKKHKQLHNISNLFELYQELDKCVLRCAFCHRDRSKRLNHHLHRQQMHTQPAPVKLAQLFEWDE